jgi:RimJ/RimL family protein N-acetyltransferase
MFARTDRLLLRPGWPEDAAALAGALADHAIVRNLAKVPWPYGLADAEAFLAAEPKAGEPDFLVFRRTRGPARLIGGIGLGRTPEGEIELGYWIARNAWGLGYATEAACAVVAMARGSLGLDRLVAGHFLDNPASGRVLEKIGFRPTGIVEIRYSAGRGESAPCRAFELHLGAQDAQDAQAATRDCRVAAMAA